MAEINEKLNIPDKIKVGFQKEVILTQVNYHILHILIKKGN